MTTKKRIAPIEARTFDQICELPRDNFPSKAGVFSILVQPTYVSIHRPEGGYWEIPRRQFDAIARWYVTGAERVRER